MKTLLSGIPTPWSANIFVKQAGAAGAGAAGAGALGAGAAGAGAVGAGAAGAGAGATQFTKRLV